MERNKWEDEFKERLNQREIAPTSHAWDRLDAMLNDAESKTPTTVKEKPVRKLTWLYIAAGIAALLLVTTVFFTQQKAEQRNEVVIHDAQNPAEMNAPIDSVVNRQPQPGMQIADRDVEPSKIKTTEQIRKPRPFDIAKDYEPIVENAPIAESVIQNQSNLQSGADEGFSPANNQQLLSAEMKTPKGVKVDPKSLLSQVDGELELTFREKTIKSIGRKYQNVKVALTNRNNQDPSAQREPGK